MKLLPALLVTGVTALFGGPVSAQHQLSTRETENVTAFARMYGYVRFFHPSDEASRISWENFAVYGCQEVLHAKSNLELMQTLNKLFKPIAPAAVVYSGKEPGLPSITPPDTNQYKVIAWQHKGIGLPNYLVKDNTYKSQRINRPVPPESSTAADYTATYQQLDAKPLQGKEFRYSGWIKVASDQGGLGLLWFRVDREKGMGFFNNMAQHPARENTWKQFAIAGRIDTDGETIFLGSILQGKGKAWFDGLKLAVKDGDNWKEIPLKNTGFEAYGEKKEPDDWGSNSQSGYEIACNQEEAKEGKSSLLISSVLPSKTTTLAHPLFAAYPRPGEYIRQTLIPGVSCAIPLALYGNADHTYPVGDSILLQSLTASLEATGRTISGDSLHTRLGGIVVAWNILRHFFPYWEDAAEKPDQWLHDGLTLAAAAKTADDFTNTLQYMTAKLNDGHIYVHRNGETPVLFPKVLFTRADGKVAVAAVLDESLKGKLQPGDVVTTVDGQPVEAYLSDLKKLISGSSQHQENRAIYKLGAGAPGTTLELGALRNGQAVTVTATRTADAQEHYKETKRTTPMGWIKPGIFYIDLDREPMDSIRSHIQEIAGAKALICDMRGYPNGNHELLEYLIKKTVNAKWMFIPQSIRPEFNGTTYTESGWELKPKSPHIKGKVFFLTDSRAISYAESYMGYVQDEHLATIIGAPTVGTNGNINVITMPGGYSFTFTGMLVKNHDGSKHHLKGIVPNVPVTPTLAGLAAGKDDVLEKALQLAAQ